MKFPCELLAEPYLAQIRTQVARSLREREFTQMEIAELLQVSQPVVSGYLKKSKNQLGLPQDLISRAIEVAEEITGILQIHGKDGTEQAIQVGCHQCKVMRQYGPTCEYHRYMTEGLDTKCTACHTKPELVELQVTKSDLLIDLSKFYNFLSAKTEFHKYIPEIGLQLVYSIAELKSPGDIVAFPGRIIKRKGNQLLAEMPSFNGSDTTSQFLMAIRETNPLIRCMMTIKSSSSLIKRIKKANFTYFIIDGLEENFFVNTKKIDLSDITSFFLIGQESVGYESITYVCTPKLEELFTIIETLI